MNPTEIAHSSHAFHVVLGDHRFNSATGRDLVDFSVNDELRLISTKETRLMMDSKLVLALLTFVVHNCLVFWLNLISKLIKDRCLAAEVLGEGRNHNLAEHLLFLFSGLLESS